MALNLDTLLDEYNGTAFAIAGMGEWGFIPRSYFVAIPNDLYAGLPDNYTINASGAPVPAVTAAQRKAFLKANFSKLTDAGLSAEQALFGAMLRLHVILRGVLAKQIQHRAVIEDEYDRLAHKGADWNAPENNIPDVPSHEAIAKNVKRFGDTYVHMLVYAFHSRGHHWQPEYDDLYNRLKKATFVPQSPGFAMPTNETLFRLLLHGFGVKPLYELTRRDQADGNMAAAMAVRFTPAPPTAGVAHITTLAAAIEAMSSESWYAAFAAKFAQPIAEIKKEVAAILASPTEYHVAAKVFGAGVRKMPSADATAAFKLLCQYALGYIEHLGRRHSLYGQEAITAKSGGMTGIADAFATACDKFGKPGTAVASMAEFLAQV